MCVCVCAVARLLPGVRADGAPSAAPDQRPQLLFLSEPEVPLEEMWRVLLRPHQLQAGRKHTVIMSIWYVEERSSFSIRFIGNLMRNRDITALTLLFLNIKCMFLISLKHFCEHIFLIFRQFHCKWQYKMCFINLYLPF